MSVQHGVLLLAYFDKSIAIRELNRTTLLQVIMVELYTTTTVIVAVVVHSMPLWGTTW